jgi:hypothetical protein
MKRLLNLIGGGIRGIIPASALVALEQQTGQLTREIFDYVGGTSTGALLAASTVAGVPATVALNVYKESGSKIFSPADKAARDVLLLARGYRFDNKVLHQVLVDALGAQAGMLINDSPIGIMITAANMSGTPWYFVKDAPTNAGTTGKATLADAAVASACATTYHQPWLLPGFGYFADGGTASLGNPIEQLGAEAFSGPGCYGSVDAADALVISLGTGTYTPAAMPPPPGGLLENIAWVTSSLVTSSETLAQQSFDRQWPGIRTSFNPELPSAIDEADVSAIPLLLEIGAAQAATLDWKTILKL